jgi:nitroreductase
MGQILSDEAMDLLFRKARTHTAWLNTPVTDDTLRRLYDLLKWPPTSANTSPARFVFLRTPQAKERLKPALSPGNVEKTMAAPVTVIVAYDLTFYEKLPKLFPHNPGMRDLFAQAPQLVEVTASATRRCRAPISSWPPARLAWIVDPCQASTMPSWMRSSSAPERIVEGARRSSSRPGTSNPISCATWATAIHRSSTRGTRD